MWRDIAGVPTLELEHLSIGRVCVVRPAPGPAAVTGAPEGIPLAYTTILPGWKETVECGLWRRWLEQCQTPAGRPRCERTARYNVTTGAGQDLLLIQQRGQLFIWHPVEQLRSCGDSVQNHLRSDDQSFAGNGYGPTQTLPHARPLPCCTRRQPCTHGPAQDLTHIASRVNNS